ncbi:uncharacterized protein ACRADG_010313 [Cochliomyia hominivorax]
MLSMKSIVLISISVVGLACVYAQIAPGSNQYLPPTKNGYDYSEPNKPFKPQPGPGTRPGTRPPPGEPGPDHVHMPGNPFDFEYAVNDIETANDYAHKASSNGDVVTGEYRVQLPDGRMQVVRYTADWKTGYHADVSYEGEPQFPQGPGGRPGYKY